MVIDRLTGLGQAWAFRNAGSREVIMGLENWVRARRRPRVLCADVAEATRSYELQE